MAAAQQEQELAEMLRETNAAAAPPVVPQPDPRVPSFAATVDGDARSPSLIDRLDTAWTGFFELFGLPHFGFIDSGATWLAVAQGWTGLGWPAIFAAFGFAIRVATLRFSLQGERATARMTLATSAVKPEFDAFQRLYKDATASKVEIAKAGEELRAARARAMKEHGTSMRATLAPVAGAPVFMYGFAVVIRAMNEPAATLTGATLPWGAGVLATDPTFVLPVVAVGLTLLNVELVFRRRRSAAKNDSGIVANAPVVARAVAIGAVMVATELRCGTLLYWSGMGLAGLLQPALMQSHRFRQWYGVPDLSPDALPHAMGHSAELPAQPTGSVSGSMAQRFPRLALLLKPGAALEAVDDYVASRENARVTQRVATSKLWKAPPMTKHGAVREEAGSKPEDGSNR